jgi:hypothetical protein
MIEVGVESGYNPTATGRIALVPQTPEGGMATGPEGKNPIVGAFIDASSGGKKARKKGPGWVYQYPNPDTKVSLLTYPGDALKAQEDNARDLRIKLQESLAVVFLDPENIKFAATTSGKALQAIKQKQLDRCDQFRDDLADRFLEPSIAMQLRIAHSLLSRGRSLKVPGSSKIMPVLRKFMVANDNGGEEWQLPTLQVKWGPYFRPDPLEQQQIIAMVREALGSKTRPLVNLRLAVERIASIFGIESVSALVEELEAASEKATQQAMNAEAGATTVASPDANTDDDAETEEAAA